MANPVEIVEIIGPCEQGLSCPYMCRGRDGFIYYVKGMQSGRDSLYKEWMCGNLGQAAGLNIPPFRIVTISEELLEEVPAQWQNVGTGPAFGSQEHVHAVWFEPTSGLQIDVEQQKLILAFDWWIANSDRNKGNTNLLYDEAKKRIVVIDHNSALDANLTFDVFCANHIFGSHVDCVFGDLVVLLRYQDAFQDAAKNLQKWLNEAPTEWRWNNREMDLPTCFDAQSAVHSLTQRALLPRNDHHG